MQHPDGKSKPVAKLTSYFVSVEQQDGIRRGALAGPRWAWAPTYIVLGPTKSEGLLMIHFLVLALTVCVADAGLVSDISPCICAPHFLKPFNSFLPRCNMISDLSPNAPWMQTGSPIQPLIHTAFDSFYWNVLRCFLYIIFFCHRI